MKFDKNNTLEKILFALFDPYQKRVPDVSRITQAMIEKGLLGNEKDIVNDHIAFRTLGVPNLGIASLEKIFLHHGYIKKDHYHFEQKKLNAYWYSPPSEKYPRIFISELIVDDLPKDQQQTVKKYTSSITSDPVDLLDLNDAAKVGEFLNGSLWALPTIEDYNDLASISEYAAWVIYNRYYLNHYTISVHELPDGYNTLETFNDFLESIGIRLNTSGGKIKVSKDGLLKQSSTVAKMTEATFSNGQQSIPGSYVEFAERLPLPSFQHLDSKSIRPEHRRDGFESSNADKIFESTYKDQTSGHQ